MVNQGGSVFSFVLVDESRASSPGQIAATFCLFFLWNLFFFRFLCGAGSFFRQSMRVKQPFVLISFILSLHELGRARVGLV